jgi:hypothetical protein
VADLSGGAPDRRPGHHDGTRHADEPAWCDRPDHLDDGSAGGEDRRPAALDRGRRRSSSAKRLRDLVAQGLVPPAQRERWDVEAEDAAWTYPTRAEQVVVLAHGRDTPPDKLARFAASLAMLDDQRLGVVVIDDASARTSPRVLAQLLGWLGSPLARVRHAGGKAGCEPTCWVSGRSASPPGRWS